MKKAVFLDRDGVINKKRNDYVKSIEEFSLLKDVPQALKILQQNEFSIIIITNQSAINRGFMTHSDLLKIHNFLKSILEKHDCFIDEIYYCPHTPDESCFCRKPNPGMILQAIKDLSINKDASWIIGDNETDVEVAQRIGIKYVKIETDSSLLDAVKKIIESTK